ncbi:unnamed protein product [Didymodactylos carnosus]|uniref:Uncharacterized protein n=1 Tax=Didymodactylos carnosus TaxID=1234261 RepID=A0A814R0K9_9BILA|nr:unnamed protein product [Didymodactylos carnosus]CAF1204689.1 unnamed protein product [Didymodactylos carnosus]CAF3890339.1 unnamed protein product [Didymodactylos carnosus]CAF4014242.1 unnamed protein product [Didymodactylos carnosus]
MNVSLSTNALSSPYELPFALLKKIPSGIKSSDYINALIHLYRGELGRQVAYRIRLDTTTNWAVTTTAGLTVLSLGQQQIPHYFHSLIAFFLVLFCIIESRRYSYYAVIQYRVHQLEKGFYGQYIVGPEREENGQIKDLPSMQDEQQQQSKILPNPSLWMCALQRSLLHPHRIHFQHVWNGFQIRLKRVYYPLLVGTYAGWIIKLFITPNGFNDKSHTYLAIGFGSFMALLGLYLYYIGPYVDDYKQLRHMGNIDKCCSISSLLKILCGKYDGANKLKHEIDV